MKKNHYLKIYLKKEEKSEPFNSFEKVVKPLELPTVNATVDMSKYITIEEHNKVILQYEEACMEDTNKLMKRIFELESELNSYKGISITTEQKINFIMGGG